MHVHSLYAPFIVLISYVTIYGQTLHKKDALGHQILAHIRIQNFEIIPSLIASGANLEVRATIFGYTPLLRAIKEAAPKGIILQLLQAGADPNAKDNSGKTALWHALTHRKDMSIAALLAHAGADLDALDTDNHNTSLLAQAINDNKHILSKWLLLHGASPLTEKSRKHLVFHNRKALHLYDKYEEDALRQRAIIITQSLEANGFARDITHLFWDIAGLPKKCKPPAASFRKRIR